MKMCTKMFMGFKAFDFRIKTVLLLVLGMIYL